jgi:hypothetical protein
MHIQGELGELVTVDKSGDIYLYDLEVCKKGTENHVPLTDSSPWKG